MQEGFLILIVLGFFFIILGSWMMKASRLQWTEFDKILTEKEASLLDPYQDIEALSNETQNQQFTKNIKQEIASHDYEFPRTMDTRIGPTPIEIASINDLQSIPEKNDNESYLEESRDVPRRILDLTREGYAAGDIARKLGIGEGEVKLIISLNNYKREETL
jgi:hypothetical protein